MQLLAVSNEMQAVLFSHDIWIEFLSLHKLHPLTSHPLLVRTAQEAETSRRYGDVGRLNLWHH